MSQSYANVQRALDDRLNAFATLNSISVKWPNGGFAPPARGFWLEPTQMPSDDDPKTLSTRERIVEGLYWVNLFCPLGIGTAEVNQKADACLKHFWDNPHLSYGGQNIQVVKTQPQKGREDGHGWWMVPLHIHWKCWMK